MSPAEEHNPMETEFVGLAERGKNNWWRYLLGVLIILFFDGSGQIVARWLNKSSFLGQDCMRGIDTIHQMAGAFTTLIRPCVNALSWVTMLLAIFLVTRFIHKRPFLSLITTENSIDWKKFGQSLGLVVALYTLVRLVELLIRPSTFLFRFNTEQFLLGVPLQLFLTPIQAAGEEILCRGYILQGLGNLTRNWPILILSSGLLFVMIHLGNPQLSSHFLPLVALCFLAGSFLTFITFKSNGLELSIGVHAGINLVVEIHRHIFIRSVHPAVQSLVSFCIVAMIFYLIMFYNGGTWWRVTSTNHLE